MSAKPHKKQWNDIKILISAASLTGTLALWNYFASISYQEKSIPPVELTLEPAPISLIVEPTTEPTLEPTPIALEGKLLLGGSAPQKRVIVQSSGGGGGGGGGSSPVTQSRSS